MKTYLVSNCKFKPQLIGAVILALMGVFSNALAQPLAQEPLLARTQSIRPNLSMVFDDSGSMYWACTYARNAYEKASVKYGKLAVDIDSCRNEGGRPDNRFSILTSVNPIYVAPQNNGMAYNPMIQYKAPYIAPNTRATNALVSNYFYHASNITGLTGSSPSIGITGYTTPFYEGLPGRPASSYSGSGFIVTPGVKIFLTMLPKTGFDPSAASLASLENYDNYNLYLVSETRFYSRLPGAAGFTDHGSTNPISKPATRTDCVANTSYCTIAEEKLNIANWYFYYGYRLLAFRSGMSEAFNNLPDTFRFNYSTLGNIVPSGSIGMSTMRNYSDGVADFYTWLHKDSGFGFNFANSVGTPLRQAYDTLGKYYQENTSNSGPWANTPWSPGTEAASAHISCRKSFAILATDGQWNNGGAGSYTYNTNVKDKDIDGNNGPLIASNPTGATYQYKPRSSDLRSIGKADNFSTSSGNFMTLADVAMYYWMTDLRSGSIAPLTNNISNGAEKDAPFWQNLNLSTVAFGATGELTEAQILEAKKGLRNWPTPAINQPATIDDLAHAAHNGGGDFLAVNDPQTFAEKMRNKLLDIASEELSTAGVVGSTQALTAGSLKIEATYISGKWWGNVSAVNLDPSNAKETGVKWRVVELNSSGIPTGTTTIPTPTTRRLYTYVDSSVGGLQFKYANLAAQGLIGTAANQLTSTWSADLTDFIRGVRLKEGEGQAFRERVTIMGDVVNSTPVFVKNTTPDRYKDWGNATQKSAYSTYRTDKANRSNGVVMIGANDGMLHVFDEKDGKELFAYIPRAVLNRLHLLADKDYAVKHKYFVDGPLVEADAYIKTPNNSGAKTTRWSNIVLGTTGAGAKAVFAIDTTELVNYEEPDILWEINDNVASTGDAFKNNLGFITQRVQTGVTRDGKWVAIFGNGQASTNGQAKLFVVDLETGALIKMIDTDSTVNNGLGGVSIVRNTNGEILGAYAGDLQGRMWRFDLSNTSSSSWANSGSILFNVPAIGSAAVQPITATPAVYGRSDGKSGYMVVFGTGKLTESADVASNYPQQRAFGIWDVASFGGTETFRLAQFSKLVQSIPSVTSTSADSPDFTFYSVKPATAIDWTVNQGWYLNYTLLDGQRQIYPVETLGKLVQLQTVAPRSTSADSCKNDGLAKGINFILDPLNGACRNGKTLDTNQDGEVDAKDSNACAVTTVGDGVNATFNKTGDIPDPSIIPQCLGSGCTPPPEDCTNDKVYSVDTTASAQLIKICDKPPPTSNSGNFTRTMRQVFIRP